MAKVPILSFAAAFARKRAEAALSGFLYFASYPALAVAFSSHGLELAVSIAAWLILISASFYAMLFKSDFDLSRAFYSMFRITLIPLSIFILLNIGITAHYIIILKGIINSALNINGTTKLILGLSYERYLLLVPKLWITAAAYAVMTVIFYLAGSLSQRKWYQ